jgi:hypothetical protein
MPHGVTWLFLTTAEVKHRQTVLCFLDARHPRVAAVFRPSAEGLHPYLCTAERFGVERRAA